MSGICDRQNNDERLIHMKHHPIVTQREIIPVHEAALCMLILMIAQQ